MWEKAKQIVTVVFVVLFFPVVLLFVLVMKLTGNDKADLSKEEVLAYLKRMDDGEVDEYGWDDFVNVPIKNAELDEVREKCFEIWTEAKNGYLVSDDDYRLNEKGEEEIKRLIKRVEGSGI
ncbi:MAG: hypothetical protein KDI36_18115 [Pseudomonadales bacterium]|nr:hypothetical protein [Pseudomonadales bacterium]